MTDACASATDCGSIGDPAGPELHTHQAHYQGELAVADGARRAHHARLPRPAAGDLHRARAGLGRPDLEGAQAAGLDAFELVADFPTSTKGYTVEADFGHVTLVFDRASRELGRCGDGRARRVGGHP